MSEPIRLNIGAGTVQIEGFTSVDRRDGHEAYPLVGYEDGSVDEIRASHILEHFGWLDSPSVLGDWVRVLKPGGRIRIAVPDFDKIVEAKGDPKRFYYLMGGQSDDNDFHKSAWTEPRLREMMELMGLKDIKRWASDNTDCASLPISLNLEGTKTDSDTPAVKLGPEGQATPELVPDATSDPGGKSATIHMPRTKFKMCAVMSTPRCGFNDAWGCIMQAFTPWRLPIRRFTGAYWEQCMERMFEDCVNTGVEWVVAVDYDTLFTDDDFSRMLRIIADNPHIDALAALQIHRRHDLPLMCIEGQTKAEISSAPLQVSSAHFGLTLINLDGLKNMTLGAGMKPWFQSQPSPKGGWGEGRIDADVWFWRQWEKAGNSLYVAPGVQVGHLQAMSRSLVVDQESHSFVPEVITVEEWHAKNELITG